MREIYLDNSATTRVLREAADAAYSAMTESYGNPSSLHKKGIEAENIMNSARREVADALGVDPVGLYFTSGGTEANNLAVIGGALAKKRRGNRVVVSAYEHDSVMKSAKFLEENGFEVTYVRPDENGVITPEAIFAAVDEKTVLVSVMTVNNEVGAINPVAKLAAAAKRKNPEALFHTDAVQAFCKLPLRGGKLGVDMITVTAHKIGGPKGVGALWIKKGVRVIARNLGGEQEKQIRSGTEALCAYFREKDKEILWKALTYFGVILVFGIGAGLGSVLAAAFGDRVIWVCCVLLSVSFGMMFTPEK